MENDLDPHARSVTLGPAALTSPESLLGMHHHSAGPELCSQHLPRTREAPTEGEDPICKMKDRFKMPSLSMHWICSSG